MLGCHQDHVGAFVWAWPPRARPTARVAPRRVDRDERAPEAVVQVWKSSLLPAWLWWSAARTSSEVSSALIARSGRGPGSSAGGLASDTMRSHHCRSVGFRAEVRVRGDLSRGLLRVTRSIGELHSIASRTPVS
jgi:hypothetical protein